MSSNGHAPPKLIPIGQKLTTVKPVDTFDGKIQQRQQRQQKLVRDDFSRKNHFVRSGSRERSYQKLLERLKRGSEIDKAAAETAASFGCADVGTDNTLSKVEEWMLRQYDERDVRYDARRALLGSWADHQSTLHVDLNADARDFKLPASTIDSSLIHYASCEGFFVYGGLLGTERRFINFDLMAPDVRKNYDRFFARIDCAKEYRSRLEQFGLTKVSLDCDRSRPSDDCRSGGDRHRAARMVENSHCVNPPPDTTARDIHRAFAAAGWPRINSNTAVYKPSVSLTTTLRGASIAGLFIYKVECDRDNTDSTIHTQQHTTDKPDTFLSAYAMIEGRERKRRIMRECFSGFSAQEKHLIKELTGESFDG